jgi:hypothetical protein
MAPAITSDPVSQADTPMTDMNDDTVPSVPVDSADAPMTVRNISFSISLPVLSHGCLRSYRMGSI